MSLFFLTIFLIYGGMHAYGFFRARSSLGFGAAAGIALALFMLLMTGGPFLVRLAERYEYELAARVISYIAYVWMALLFLFFCASVFIDAINILSRATGWLTGKRFAIPAKPSFFIASGLAVIISLYGYWSALDIRTERFRVETLKLPRSVERLTIVQISDVHLGLIVRQERLRKIMDIVKAEKPDIFISSGDLVDAQINHLEGLAALLREVNPPCGKFAITGNHEYYAGLQQALSFTRDAGFTLLRGGAVKHGPINIVGVDDPAAIQMNMRGKMESETALLAGLPREKFTLLLKHRPTVDEAASKLFDLQISGHTHKGQIFPFNYFSALAYPMGAGSFVLPAGSILRVSRGTGTWGPPIRFLSPPEVTVIEIVRKAD